MRRTILIVAGTALAVWAGYDAALAWSRSDPAARALPAFARDPANRLRANEVYFTTPEALGSHANALQSGARAALVQTPLNPAALRQLAMIEALDEGGSTDRLLDLASRTSRRDLTNELLFIETAVAKGEVGAAIVHYDHVLSVHPNMRTQLFPILSAAIEEREIRNALLVHARRPWFATFLRGSIGQGADINAATGLALAARRKIAPETYELLVARMADQAMKRGAHGEAFRLIASLPGAGKGTLDALGFSRATSDPRFAPFSWQLTQSESLTALPGKGGDLLIEIRPDRTERAAERITLLAPGGYRVAQEIAYIADDPKPLAAWDVACMGAGNPRPLTRVIFRPDEAASHPGWNISVPGGCEAQRWRLTVTAAEASRPSAMRIAAFGIRPQ